MMTRMRLNNKLGAWYYFFIIIVCFLLSGCILLQKVGPKPQIIASSPREISIRSVKGVKPHIMAAEHCAKHGRQWEFLGGYPIGEPSLAVIYGYSCIEFE